jgi:two-component system OmpR family sensor kinase
VSLPIRVRLTAWFAALLAATVIALSVFLVIHLRADLLNGIDEEVRIASVQLSKSLINDADQSGEAPDDPAEADRDFEQDARAILSPSAAGAQLLDSRGRTLARYGSVAGAEPMIADHVRAAAMTAPARTLTLSLGDQDQRYRARVSSLRIEDEVRVLVVAESLRPVDDAVRRVVVLLLIAGPAALLTTGLAAYWLAYRALRPVERITTDAREIGIDRLDERLAVPKSHDETWRLAVTLNAMLARIEQGVFEKRRLLADASHELRTPLAIMRNEIDVALVADEMSPAAREVLRSSREEVDRMTRTIDNMLTSAQVDEGRLELLTTPVDLRQLVDDAVRALRPLADAKNVSLVARGDRWEVQVDPPRLQLVLTNLIDNAVKFSQTGTTVRIDTWGRDEEVGVTVTDEGPGISATDAEHLFDRYYRADSPPTADPGGSGLGLAICREVVVAHGGRLWVDSPAGRGSAFSLALPPWRSLQTRLPAASMTDDSARPSTA